MLDKLIDEIPLDLRIAVAATLEDPSLNCGCPEVVAAISAKYSRIRVDQKTITEWQNAITVWVDSQRLLQDDAENTLSELWQRFTPKNTDIPAWFGKKWSFDLRNSWSASLGQSIQEARAWMAEQ